MASDFDVADVADLPAELQRDIQNALSLGGGTGRVRSKYVELLTEAGRPVTVNEIRAAIYRKTGRLPLRESVNAALLSLKKRGRVIQPKRGFWAVKNTDGNGKA